MGRTWDNSGNHRRPLGSLDWRDLQPFGGRRCQRGSAAARDCSRMVEAPGACFFIRSIFDGPRSALMGAGQERCRAMNSRLEPTRAPHVAAQGNVLLNNCQ